MSGDDEGTRLQPVGTCRLEFRHRDELTHVLDPVRRDLSAAASAGDDLFVAGDETATVERLTRDEDGNWRHHHNIAVGDFVDLPAGAIDEMDIEGLAIDDGYLWITGSHSLKRNKPEPSENTTADALDELTDIDGDPNRWFLGRLPLHVDADGRHQVLACVDSSDGPKRPAALAMDDDGGNALSRAAADDPHLAPFLTIPSKENGFDVEGLAVRGDQAYLGLRGPVLRGWAVVLEIRLKATKRDRLKLRKLRDGHRIRKHFVALDGLGIRDLLFEGRALLLLAGPTMDLDGPVRLYRWPLPLDGDGDTVSPRSTAQLVGELPHGRGHDHAEAICPVEGPDGDRLLVLYDSPAPGRLVDEHAIIGDLFALPFHDG